MKTSTLQEILLFTPQCNEWAPSWGVPHELSANLFVTRQLYTKTSYFQAASKKENLHVAGHIIIHTPMRRKTVFVDYDSHRNVTNNLFSVLNNKQTPLPPLLPPSLPPSHLPSLYYY